MATKMQALIKEHGSIAVKTLPRPNITLNNDVLIRVELAGLCRTDLYVADGRIQGRDPLILGHEFAGTVEDAGDNCGHLVPGIKVCVNPLLPCGICAQCDSGSGSQCQRTEFLGVDRDGCFAGYALVPASSVLTLAPGITFKQAAYAEPVAASLAVFKSGIQPGDKGLLIGKNRFSHLMQKILLIKKFHNLTVLDTDETVPENEFDFVIETSISSDTLGAMIRAVRPGGKVILKSRSYDPVTLRLHEAIRKEPVLYIVNYGSFAEALDLLASGELQIDDLVDGIYPLTEFKEVIARSRKSESLKPFFAPWNN